LVRENFQLVARGGAEWIEGSQLTGAPWILHAFSLRRRGAERDHASGLNLGFTSQAKRAEVARNRHRFFRALGAERFALASLRQTHSSTIYRAVRAAGSVAAYQLAGSSEPPTARDVPPAGDALLTDDPGVLLAVRTADCLPVLLADGQRKAVAAVHAGWRGALACIVEKAVGEMRRWFGSQPQDLQAVLGPSIRACCYEVGQEVVDAFCGRFPRGESFFHRDPVRKGEAHLVAPSVPTLSLCPPGHGPAAPPAARLDLVAVARDQLLRAGLRPGSIQVMPFCTACRTDLCFSYRKEGVLSGRMLAVIGIRP
jgi:polyphenol oxidase